MVDFVLTLFAATQNQHRKAVNHDGQTEPPCKIIHRQKENAGERKLPGIDDSRQASADRILVNRWVRVIPGEQSEARNPYAPPSVG
jgi:hypothetical protein